MKNTISKSDIAIVLSSMNGFYEPKVREEQYMIDSEVGASMLWNAYLLGDIKGKVITDLGCGTGLIGIGAIMLGAKFIYFVDSDKNALELVKKNISELKSEDCLLKIVKILNKDIKNIKIKSDIVMQNPPFGTKVKHRDIFFLKKALEIAPVVYSFHKSESEMFIKMFATKNNAKITHLWKFKFPLKSVFSFHRKRIHRINVICFRFERDKSKIDFK